MIHVPIIFSEKIIQFRQILAVYKINNLFLFFISSKVFSSMAKSFNLHLTQMAYIHIYIPCPDLPDSYCLLTSPLEYLKGTVTWMTELVISNLMFPFHAASV